MNKNRQKKRAREAGLPVVDGQSVSVKRSHGVSEYVLPDGIKYPCFIKPNVSMTSSKSKMQACRTEEELRRALDNFSKKPKYSVMVEDCINIGKEYSLLGVSIRNKAVGPALFVADIPGADERRGVAVTGRTLPVDTMQSLVDRMVTFVSSLDYTGLYDIDLIESAEGDIYFVEINMRFGASGYAFTCDDLNMPAMFADYMFKNRPLDTACSYPNAGTTFVSERGLLESYSKSEMTRKEVDEIIDKIDVHFIKDDEDPKPFRVFRAYFIPGALLRLKQKLSK